MRTGHSSAGEFVGMRRIVTHDKLAGFAIGSGDLDGLLLDDRRDELWILLREPAEPVKGSVSPATAGRMTGAGASCLLKSHRARRNSQCWDTHLVLLSFLPRPADR